MKKLVRSLAHQCRRWIEGRGAARLRSCKANLERLEFFHSCYIDLEASHCPGWQSPGNILHFDAPLAVVVKRKGKVAGVVGFEILGGTILIRQLQGAPKANFHDGTTTLFATLNVAEGSVISTCLPRHRHQEWLRFLRLIDRQIPQDKALHLIADNYATHKHPTVQRWLTRHPHIHMHFTPTSSSWLNLVKRVFGDLSAKQLRRGVFRSVPELIAAIDAYMTQRNAQPKPFVWTKSAQAILTKVNRAKIALDKTRTA